METELPTGPYSPAPGVPVPGVPASASDVAKSFSTRVPDSVFPQMVRPAQTRRQAPRMPRTIHSQRRRRRGSGNGPASDIRHSGALAGKPVGSFGLVDGRGDHALGSGIWAGIADAEPPAEGAAGSGSGGIGLSPTVVSTGAALAVAANGLPQFEQNLLPSGFSFPHREQTITSLLHPRVAGVRSQDRASARLHGDRTGFALGAARRPWRRSPGARILAPPPLPSGGPVGPAARPADGIPLPESRAKDSAPRSDGTVGGDAAYAERRPTLRNGRAVPSVAVDPRPCPLVVVAGRMPGEVAG